MIIAVIAYVGYAVLEVVEMGHFVEHGGANLRHGAVEVTAYERYLQEKSEQMRYFRIDANDEVWSIRHDDIIFFETSSKVSHRIILHTENGEIDFRGALSEIEPLIPELYRCHKSYLLNLNKIAYIDKATKEAVMMNGERTHIAEKKMSELVGMIGDR